MNAASIALLTLQSFLLIGTARGAGTPCETFTDCTALKTAILDPGNNGNVNVCVSSTPIVCDETKNPIYLNDDVSMTSFQLNCVCNELECKEEERCVLDYTPTSAYDGSTAYGGFILQDQRTLTVDGFDFVNLRGKGRLFYNQHGSTLTIRNSVFQNNVYTGLDGNNPIIVYDGPTSGPTSTTIENSLFQGNEGSLLGFQAGSATLKNNIFYDNSLPSGYESAFTSTSFIFWKSSTDATFVLQGNQFHSFQAPASSGVHDKFFMISATDPSKSVSTNVLLADVTGNCAANNEVAGNYINSGLIPNGSIIDCNNGVYTAGAWPYRECRLLEGQPECPLDYGPTGPRKPTIPTYAIDADRVYFSIAVDDDTAKGLDLVPNAVSNHLVDQLAPPADLFPFDGTDTRSNIVHSSVPPVYYSDTDSECNPPTGADDPDSTWSGNGCVCFETDPHPGVSYYDMVDQTDASNPATGYRTAFDTSVTGGVTIAGWFKAGNTTGAPWYAQDGHPGQQTSLIFVRGEKASWKAGYNLGMGNWNGWSFGVILKGPSNTRYSLSVQSPTNSYPGIDVWHYVVGTYDAEKGRASIYVDNQLVGTKTVGITFDREARDIQWSFESENAKTRIGNGYDYNDKNFHGCTGGIKVYSGAVQVSETPFTSLPSPTPFISSGNCPIETNPAADTASYGEMKFCVRSSLGYSYGATNKFQEVNYIESLIKIRYNLESGFCVADFNVEPKERIETTQEEAYALQAWLCDTNSMTNNINPVRQLPTRVTTYDTVGGTNYYNQGALITVCVSPDDEAYAEGIRMSSLRDFTWKRDTFLGLPSLEVEQTAIENSSPAGNYLTHYDSTACSGAEWCTFSSILVSDFYINTGSVTGSGTAQLEFGRRRLEEGDQRKLQGEDSSSTFDLNLGVIGIDDGPAALKTAGAVTSFGFYTLYCITTLVAGLALLA